MQSDGTIIGSGNNRPDEPRDWAKTDTSRDRMRWENRPIPANVSVPMTYHHIMPWSDIWRGWNTVVQARQWDVLRAWAYILKIDHVVEQMIGRLQEDPNNGMAGGFTGPETTSDIMTKVCWSPWNLVEGPTHRTKGGRELEDPGDALDIHYRVSWKLSQRQMSIVALHGLLANCRRAVSLPDGEGRESAVGSCFKELLKKLKQMRFVRNQSLQSFDPTMWRPARLGSVDSDGNLVSEARYDAHGRAYIKRTQLQKANQTARGLIRHTIWEKMPRS